MGKRRTITLVLVALLMSTLISGCSLWGKRKATPLTSVGGAGSVTIRGVVRNSDGLPLSDVKVSVQGTDLQVKSDVGGSFELVGVPSGSVALEFSKSQFIMTVKNFQAAGSQPVVANVTMSPLDASLHNGWLAAKGFTGKCGSCHQLHTTTEAVNPSLLVENTVNGTCFGCHNGTNRGPARATYEATGHSPTQLANSSTLQVWSGMSAGERGNCSTCHEPHGTKGTKTMLRAGTTSNTNNLCLACHEADGTNNTKRWPGSTGYAKATNLHYNPPLPGNGTLRTYPGTAYAAGECLNCHQPHGAIDGGSVTPAMTRAKDEKLCIKCHTGFATRIPAGTSVKHKCSLCHNPHVVESGNKFLIARGSDKTQQTTDSKKTGYRGQTLLSNAYCLDCHNGNADNPYRGVAPVPQNSAFKDGRWDTSSPYRDLHNVHIVGVRYGTGTVADHGWQYDPNSNRLRCVDCHDVHPTAGPTRPGGMSSKNLRTDRISALTPSSGTYNGKAGCGTLSPCHYDSFMGTQQGRSCLWCHSTSSGGQGAPGGDCTSQHGYSYHSTVVLP